MAGQPTADGRTAAVWHALICAAVVVVAVTANASAVHWRDNLADSHLFGYYGWCVSQGARPYLDVWDNKPPGIWWVNAAAFRVFGPGEVGELCVCTLAAAGTLIAFGAIAVTVYGRSLLLPALLTGGVLLTHVGYECGANRTETFVVLCETLVVLGYLRWLRRRRWAWLACAGFFGGAALLFKQAGVAAGTACALHLLWTQVRAHIGKSAGSTAAWWKPWLVAGACFALAPVAAGGVLAAQGALGQAWFAIVGFNRAYFEIRDATLYPTGPVLRLYAPALPPLYGLLLLAVLAAVLRLAAAFLRRVRQQSATEQPVGFGLLWLWLLLAFYLACVGPGRLSYHLMPTLPALGLIALYPLDRLAGQRGLGARIVARPSVAAALVVYGFIVAGLAADNARQMSRCWSVKPHWYALQRRQPAPYELQAAELRRLTGPDERIYVWGWSPGTYRYAYRRCVSRFATLEKTARLGERARFLTDGAIADIMASPPAAFVISVGDLPALMQSPRSPFADWLDRNYKHHGEFDGMHILLPRNAPTSSTARRTPNT
jgi:4-amino-4-deoxy-L-arabinose transferase-like glycosyltransferase